MSRRSDQYEPDAYEKLRRFLASSPVDGARQTENAEVGISTPAEAALALYPGDATLRTLGQRKGLAESGHQAQRILLARVVAQHL